MRFWLELHCDTRDTEEGCANLIHDWPAGLFGDLRVGRATLERYALERGWKKHKPVGYMDEDGWVQPQKEWRCGFCASRMQVRGW